MRKLSFREVKNLAQDQIADGQASITLKSLCAPLPYSASYSAEKNINLNTTLLLKEKSML